MRCHGDFSNFLAVGLERVVDIGKHGVHQVVIGELVIDAKKCIVLQWCTEGQRYEADKVIIVSKLLGLCIGGLVFGVEGRCAGQNGVAPTNEDVTFVVRRNMMMAINTMPDFSKPEGGRRATGCQRERDSQSARGEESGACARLQEAASADRCFPYFCQTAPARALDRLIVRRVV